ncbi:glycogen debranching protein GlgX [Aminobacter anthyllidis]|uniref:Glycogen debranching protein GlgX n=1 Tax=Aminobacter anthyllidis TaxID=1035067 RepID=A0A9X1D3Q1_9HYPH|nr:glycogen debranching protein GlgX [Aminobacter anthyllidis]MBT1155357.1 glycogen debranching protein GlgX [Aminobacter anthyllidis]
MPMGAAAEYRPRFGATVTESGIRFAAWSGAAERMWVSIFGADSRAETDRLELQRESEGVFALSVPGLGEGTRYGFRADGRWAPNEGLWFDPDKLLVDPYAASIDRAYRYDGRLAAPRGQGRDTAQLMPKAVATTLQVVPPAAPIFRPSGLIYEVPVRAFSMAHPGVPKKLRGTLRALAEPAVIEHLLKLGVSAVELMPVTATMDERHLPRLGLTNAWGYNPVTFMALDPRLAPGGMADLRETTAALHAAGIGVILDLVFNHTAESDELGPTLSLRGLDNRAYYREAIADPGRYANDTGTGNTLACDHPVAGKLILDSLRHFVVHGGVDGFRFDLAPVLGRVGGEFTADAPLLQAMRADAIISDRILIAEPWDIGHNGYRLGGFPQKFLEWNDRYRDDVRRFWRGDRGMVGALATRLAGSSDTFGSGTQTRTVNFVAAHDGMTLADIVRYERKHNEANGEHNHDGHNENFSWNNGVEGESGDREIAAERDRDIRALLATLFASRGAIMLTAGDEFGRTQRGNNNAYAQDNELTWLDWAHRDVALEDFVAALGRLRREVPALAQLDFLRGATVDGSQVLDVEWLTEAGRPMGDANWHEPDRHRLAMLLGNGDVAGGRLAVMINGTRRETNFALPARKAFDWLSAMSEPKPSGGRFVVPARSVAFAIERPAADSQGDQP